MKDLLTLMKDFRRAYAKADRDGLLAATTHDFTWHQHFATSEDDLPTGRVLNGVDELLDEIAWRGEHWQDVEYVDMVERATEDLLVQTFTIRGIEDGKPFHANVVDLYPVKNGRIERKDTYWKQFKQR